MSTTSRKIRNQLARINRLNRVIAEIEQTGTASASLAAGGGSKSYTRIDLKVLYERLDKLRADLKVMRLQAAGSPFGIRHVVTVR